MQDRPTIRDIAARTGLSSAAVSMALRDHPRIGVATRLRVREAAQAMGYSPDPVMASIASHRWRRNPAEKGPVLALLTSAPHTASLGIVEHARKLGYRMEEISPTEERGAREIGDQLWWRGITGIVVGQSLPPAFCHAFDWSRFAAVACGEGQCRLPIDVVMPDHYASVQDAWDIVWARGFRRIGLAIFDLPQELDIHDREAAYWERQRHCGAAEMPVLYVPTFGGGDDVRGREAWYWRSVTQVRAWLRACRPDAVLGFNETFYWLLESAGYAVPDRLPFASLWINMPNPAQTGMELHQTEVSARAVDWLDLLLRTGQRGPSPHPRTIRIEFSWRDGPWLPPAKTVKPRAGRKPSPRD